MAQRCYHWSCLWLLEHAQAGCKSQTLCHPIYREIWQLSVNRFRFKAKENPRKYVASIARSMSNYDEFLNAEETLVG